MLPENYVVNHSDLIIFLDFMKNISRILFYRMAEENWDDDDWNKPKHDRKFENTSNRSFDNNFNKPDNVGQHRSYRNNSNQSSNNRGFNQNHNDRRNQSRTKSSNPAEEKCTIFIETSKLGKLIGRGGSKIRDLQDESNTNIVVSRNFMHPLILSFLFNIIFLHVATYLTQIIYPFQIYKYYLEYAIFYLNVSKLCKFITD